MASTGNPNATNEFLGTAKKALITILLKLAWRGHDPNVPYSVKSN